ncbi:hypothetical protein C491_17584 [Natronococcus amylolyticus DSM 10524]|uniref:DUF8168 domain-containing protein n=1 Tax=Natronococcus amylolyticus DSM 10524 TaxID=1227497 RepID=L9WZW3_9EURY|nr:hypothetical protein [Natronococcus amylolyticus]ELY54932.1 hypothetical protein C491_17584 [Natronococcus amylolyticus DSM 10524]
MRIAVYRHDTHKLTGQSHAHADETFAGVPVNQSVPHGADGDAARLSRPSGTPELTVANHTSPHRLSLLTGDSVITSVEPADPEINHALRELLTETDPKAMHAAWLASDVAALFNESLYYPYTSLKYHTLLVAALVDNYSDGYEFDELRLVVDPPDEIVPHRTVYTGDRFALRIDRDANRRPSARLGARPWRSWATVWSQLSGHPLTTDRFDMVLDANLRRIRAWSTALQYLEDFQKHLQQSEVKK